MVKPLRTWILACALLPALAQGAHRFQGLGALHWTAATKSADAQAYFDQGLAFLYGFNHEEAIRAFTEATRLDPGCAMAWWGLATAHGPHINRPGMDDLRAKAAHEAAAKAVALAAPGGTKAAALAKAAMTRFSQPVAEGWAARDQAYACAMREVWRAFPSDANVGILFAESLMDLHPWDLWDGRGHPRTDTVEIIATLDRVLKLDPTHPQALHLSIHLWEASPTPDRARIPADRLRHRQPGLGHMDHMPSHIDVRLGNWAQAIAANELARRADQAYLAVRKPEGLQPLYQSHSVHMLGFAAMMSGHSAKAFEAMAAADASVPADTPTPVMGRMDWFKSMPFEARKRFGRWEELLSLPEPAAAFPLARAMRHADRGIAFAALGRVEEARAEAAQFKAALEGIGPDLMISRTRARSVLAVAGHLLDGEVHLAAGELEAGLASLRQGVDAEDALTYSEPPTWLQPVRHALGAALLRANRMAEALAVFDADLARWPRNIWSLQGRWQALAGLQRRGEALRAKRDYAAARAQADVDITTPCLCQPAAAPSTQGRP